MEGLCPICLDDDDVEEKKSKLKCGHEFHCECIMKWILLNYNSCPTCRRHIITLSNINYNDDNPYEKYRFFLNITSFSFMIIIIGGFMRNEMMDKLVIFAFVVITTIVILTLIETFIYCLNYTFQ